VFLFCDATLNLATMAEILRHEEYTEQKLLPDTDYDKEISTNIDKDTDTDMDIDTNSEHNEDPASVT
jgi:hypothetical protein